MTTGESIIEFHSVSFSYQHAKVLSGLSHSFAKYANTVLFGGNGAGKSTLLNLAAKIIVPTRGKIVRNYRGRSAIVLQDNFSNTLLPITVEECVSMGRWQDRPQYRSKTAEDQRVIDEALETLKITHLRKKQLNELSGGQRQRALLAQMLTQQSELVLLDEPATGLDIDANNLIQEVIHHLVKNGSTVIQASHSVEVAQAADEVVLMREGEIIAAGDPAEMLTEEKLLQLF